MSGFPAAAANVGSQSSCETMSVQGRCRRGNARASGRSKARDRRLPSSSFSRRGTAWCRHPARCCSADRCPWNTGRWCSSGEAEVIDELRAVRRRACRARPCRRCIHPGRRCRDAPPSRACGSASGCRSTRQKNGCAGLGLAVLMKSLAAAMASSSTVSMRFLVSGPVFSIFCPPLPSAQVWSTPRGPYFLRNSGFFGVVQVLRLFFGS